MEHFLGRWREHGLPWPEWMEVTERVREAFARVIRAQPHEVAIMPNASEGAFQVASTLCWERRPGIVTCDMEFPSVAHVWLAQRSRSARIEYAPERDGLVEPEDYVRLVDEQTGLVSVPPVSYRNGSRLPVEEVTRRAREVGARVFVDAYQAAGVLPVDVRRLDCDYLVAGTSKYLLGAPGLAFLYVRGGLVQDRDPQLTGWFGRGEPFAFEPRRLDFPAEARRYETGTPAIPAACASVAGMSLIEELDPGRVTAHVAELADELTEDLRRAGETLYSPLVPERRGPMVAVAAEHPEDLGAFLAGQGVVASPRGRAVRLSLHYYNDSDDLARARDAIRAYRGRATG
ncbi:MAG: aminotransferase class V-fold PLP-dependent enzyme [Streptosporangiales bacterium]|nr:aminotransferase class V-fold PLP-dependent enzyme [Streptosporangiales bacterium]